MAGSYDEYDVLRSSDFARPWKLGADASDTPAILDADGAVVAFLDPSWEEYAPALTVEAAQQIVELVNHKPVDATA